MNPEPSDVLTPDLTGEWRSIFSPRPEEIVKITHEGDSILAVKITGSQHVSAGKVSFWANLKTGEAEGQVAEKDFRNPQFVRGLLEVLKHDRIRFTYIGIGEMEFRKED